MTTQGIRYGNYHIYYDPPPIPIRSCDWHYVHDDYDGAPIFSDGPPADHRCGSAASVEDCKREIDELEQELAS